MKLNKRFEKEKDKKYLSSGISVNRKNDIYLTIDFPCYYYVILFYFDYFRFYYCDNYNNLEYSITSNYEEYQ